MMLYNNLVEECFFYPRYAGFARNNAVILLDYRPSYSEVKITFALEEGEGARLTTLKFKAQGNPYILAACEWICRQYVSGNVASLVGMGVEQWTSLMAIERVRRPTAVEINEVCARLLQVMHNIEGELHE